jgi:hypothetical protein
MPSFSEIFSSDDSSDSKGATETSTAEPFVPDPGEGDPADSGKPEGGDGGSTIASGSTFGGSDDFAA